MEIILTCGIVPEPWHCFPPTFVLCFSKANSFQYFLKTHLGSKINASEAQRVSCWFWFFLSCFVFMTCPEQRLTRLSSLPKSLEVRPLLFLHTLLLEEKHTFHYAELIACLTDDRSQNIFTYWEAVNTIHSDRYEFSKILKFPKFLLEILNWQEILK